MVLYTHGLEIRVGWERRPSGLIVVVVVGMRKMRMRMEAGVRRRRIGFKGGGK